MYKYKFLQVGQLPREHLSFLQNPLIFFITEYLKHEVDGDLSIWVYKCSSCGLFNWKFKELSMIKRQWHCRGVPLTSITKLLLLPKFDNSSPSVTRDKGICHMILSYWHHYRLRQSTQWNPLNDVYLLPKFDVPSLRTLKT